MLLSPASQILDEQVLEVYRLLPKNNTVRIDHRTNAIYGIHKFSIFVEFFITALLFSLAQNGSVWTQVLPMGPYIMWEGWLQNNVS